MLRYWCSEHDATGHLDRQHQLPTFSSLSTLSACSPCIHSHLRTVRQRLPQLIELRRGDGVAGGRQQLRFGGGRGGRIAGVVRAVRQEVWEVGGVR